MERQIRSLTAELEAFDAAASVPGATEAARDEALLEVERIGAQIREIEAQADAAVEVAVAEAAALRGHNEQLTLALAQQAAAAAEAKEAELAEVRRESEAAIERV